MTARAAAFVVLTLAAGACGEDDAPPVIQGEVESDQALRDAAHHDSQIVFDENDQLLVDTMPYLGGYRPRPDEVGVLVHEEALVQPGLNLYCAGHAPAAFLMTMDGTTRHTWRLDMATLWPALAEQGHGDHWRRVALRADGGLLAIYEGVGIVALDRDSEVQWSWRGGCHHDLDVQPDGTIAVLSRVGRVVPEVHPTQAVLEDFVTYLTPDGTPTRQVSVLRCLLNSPWKTLLDRAPKSGDILHTNTIQVLDGSQAAQHDAFTAGNLLVSMPFIDTLAILDPVRHTVAWAHVGTEGSRWRMQHDPMMLPNGHMLVFDNMGERGLSKVLEFDPTTLEERWAFRSSDARPFSSVRLGAVQRLANGNTLITESVPGVALEVTADGTIVWEFVNPHPGGEGTEMLRRFLDQARQREGQFDPRFVSEIEETLTAAADGELAATLLDCVRVPFDACSWLN